MGDRSATRNNRLFLLVTLLLGLSLAFKERLTDPPVLPSAVAHNEFDTGRAFSRLTRILGDQQVHGVDSAAADGVRARLLEELRHAGLRPQVRDIFRCQTYPEGRTVRCARIRNVTATIGGGSGRHLLLATHYDSSTVGPGASDAGMGVATLLEVGSLLRLERLPRPVTLLFDEGEEAGLLGAAAFLADDPLAGHVDSLVNLEARGVSGPALMFETSQPNGPAISAFAAAARHPAANSMSTDFYALIPNSTDVDIFAPRRWTTLNFAVIGNETRYHSPGDSLAAMDQRSLHHMGSQTLAAARALLNQGATTTPQLVYADLLGWHLITIPQTVALVMLGLMLCAFAWLGWRRQALARPLLVVLTAMLGGVVPSLIGEWVMGATRGGEYWRAWPISLHLAVYAGTLAISVGILVTLGARLTRQQLRVAFWLLFLLAGAGVSCIAPGAAIFFLAGPLLALLGIVASHFHFKAEQVGQWLAIAIMLALFLPVLALVEMLLVSGPAWILAPLAGLVILPIVIELLPGRSFSRSVLALPALLMIAGWTATAFTPAYSADRKQRFAIEYVRDVAANRGHWAIYNDGAALPAAYAGLGPWKREVLDHARGKRWVANAGNFPVASPSARVIDERTVNGHRHLKLRLQANGADLLSLVAARPGAIAAAGTNGALSPLGKARSKAEQDILTCQGRSCDGAVVDLVVDGKGAMEVKMIAAYFRLPPQAKSLLEHRPATAAPQYSPDASYAVHKMRL